MMYVFATDGLLQTRAGFIDCDHSDLLQIRFGDNSAVSWV